MSLSIVLLGLALLVLAPLLQSILGNSTRIRVTISGLILVILGLFVSVLSDPKLSPAFLIAIGILALGLAMYISLRIRISRRPLNLNLTAVEHCASELTRGRGGKRVPTTGADLGLVGVWSGLGWAFKCTPTDSSLRERLSARGHDYYVLWASLYEVDLDRTINIECDEQCTIAMPLDKVGPKEKKDRSLDGRIAEDIQVNGKKVTIEVVMGVALDAAEVKVTLKGSSKGVSAETTIKFPKASKASPSTDMGTYEWKCKAVEGTEEPTGTTHSGSGEIGDRIRGWRVDEFDIVIGQEYYVFDDYELFVSYVNDLRNDPDSKGEPRCWEVTGELIKDEGGSDGKVIRVDSAEEIQVE